MNDKQAEISEQFSFPAIAPLSKSDHYIQVENFMVKAGQNVPSVPTIPSVEVRELRAKLLLEETFETVRALGFNIYVDATAAGSWDVAKRYRLANEQECDIVEVVDGICDVSVVSTGCLISFGIADVDPQRLVNDSNMAKFAPGWYRSDGTDGNPAGKVIKPKDWKKPDLMGALRRQGYAEGKVAA